MWTQDEAKVHAAEAALSYLPEAGVLGLGTGSTARHFIDKVGALVAQGRRYSGVPTSQQSREQAEALGIQLLSDEGPFAVDVCVDGADEVSENLDLIKGGGAAHTREKIVNQASRLNVIIVDESKLSTKLGEKWAVPVEVLPYGHRQTALLLARFGEPRLRFCQGAPVTTDSGNWIYDLAAGVIENPQSLEAELGAFPGVVETGLFCGRADIVLVAGVTGVRSLRRPG